MARLSRAPLIPDSREPRADRLMPHTPEQQRSERRSAWLTPERQAQVRTILLAIVLFFGLVVWVFHSVAAATERAPEFVHKLRVVGVLTWIYALVQLLDMRFYHSRFARRRHISLGIPEHLIAWRSEE